jgi:hypothetical protein
MSLISMVSSLIGNKTQNSNNKRAMAEQQASSDAQRAYLEQIGQQTDAAFNPYTGAGGRGLAGYEHLMYGEDPTQVLRNTPGYEFMMNEGVRARDASAANRGNLLSGAQMKEMQTFGQGMADQTYQQALDNNFRLGQMGLNATGAQEGMRSDRMSAYLGTQQQDAEARGAYLTRKGTNNANMYGDIAGTIEHDMAQAGKTFMGMG